MKPLTAVLALALVASTAAAGAATTAYLSGSGPFKVLASSAEEAHVLTTFEKTFETPITTGVLDLRIDWGAVRVVGWPENAFKVVVYETPAEGEAASDHETLVDFVDATKDGHLDLKLTVDRQGTYAVGASANGFRLGDSRADRAILAYVPAAALYESVFLCTGQDMRVLGGVTSLLPEDLFPGHKEPSCLAAEDAGANTIRVNLMDESGADLGIVTGVENLNGEALKIATRYGDVAMTAAAFRETSLIANHGAVEILDVDAGTLAVAVNYGDLLLEGAALKLSAAVNHGDVAAKGAFAAVDVVANYGDVAIAGVNGPTGIVANHGDVAIAVDPLAAGKVDVAARYGDVKVLVERRAGLGYEVDGFARYGDVEIILKDAKVSNSATEDRHSQRGKAKTTGFDKADLQTSVKIIAEHGDILVTDGSNASAEADEEGQATAVPALAPLLR